MRRSTDWLIETLAANAAPVRPLASPMRRALTTLAALSVLGALLVAFLSGPELVRARAGDGETRFVLEQLAMALTGILAIAAAFHLSIPGRPRGWLLAPVLPLLAWLSLSGWGCYDDFLRNGSAAWEIGRSVDCLGFIIGAGVLIGIPLILRLSRASPIDPVPVAVTGGLGSAAIAALLLQFFHPFTVTVMDLAVHVVAIAIVIAAAVLLRRRMAFPA